MSRQLTHCAVSRVSSPGGRIHVGFMPFSEHAHDRQRRQDAHSGGRGNRMGGHIPDEGPFAEWMFSFHTRKAQPSWSNMAPSGRTDKTASKLRLPPPGMARSACSTASILFIRVKAVPASGLFAFSQADLNCTSLSRRHVFQGQHPATKAVASSRQKSFE